MAERSEKGMVRLLLLANVFSDLLDRLKMSVFVSGWAVGSVSIGGWGFGGGGGGRMEQLKPKLMNAGPE